MAVFIQFPDFGNPGRKKKLGRERISERMLTKKQRTKNKYLIIIMAMNKCEIKMRVKINGDRRWHARDELFYFSMLSSFCC